jgi:hypothetical protein
MEYPEYGIYKLPQVDKSKKTKKISNSLPLKDSKRLVNESNCPDGIMNQIYDNINIVISFIEDVGELLDHRVIM